MIKKYFLTGLAVLLPLVITFWVFAFIVNLLTIPFQNFVEGILRHYGLAGLSFLFFSPEQTLAFISKLLILITLVLGTLLIGLLGRKFLANYVIKVSNFIMYRIPILKIVYKAVQDVLNFLLEGNSQAFSQVVLVPFPGEKSFSIGLIINKTQQNERTEEKLSIFIPATPNPAMGYLVMLKKSQLIFLDMKVEDALKAIISCGIVFSHIKD